MGKPVWQHSKRSGGEIAARIVAFCAGRDVTAVPACDEALLLEDLAANEASFLALAQAGVFTGAEAQELASALVTLRERILSGEFKLDPQLEDVHINIESVLRDEAGEVSGKLHSGRSRNDQVACDLRQWHRRKILDHLASLLETVSVFLSKAEREVETVMPGFSHHQRAFATTWGHQIASYAQAWIRDLERGLGVLERVNRSPLGAAAGFGTSWPLDRTLLADLLGFNGIVENSLDAVSSRLEVEQDVAAWLALWMTHCSTVAQDLILYSTEEFGFIRLAVETTTGSSIMPQKRNPDFAEVVKGKTSLVHGALAALLSLGKGQPSGYHRDSQCSKPLGQDLWREVISVPDVFRMVFENLAADRARMRKAAQGGFLDAAEWADAIAQDSGLPFRDVYSAVGVAVDRCRKKGSLDRATVNGALREAGLSYQVKPDLAKNLGSPLGLVARRNTLGSPNPESVRTHLAQMRVQLGKLEKQVRGFAARILRKDKKRVERIRELADGSL